MGGPVPGPPGRNLGTPGCPRNWAREGAPGKFRGTRAARWPARGPLSDAPGVPLSGLLATLWLLAAPAGGAAEPGLAATQDAAARAAAGSGEQDAARLWRARNAHWAPQLRLQGGEREDERLRAGEYRAAPVREQDAGAGRNWSVALSWDFAQVIFAREETQLAIAQARLARIRREAAERAAALWVERQQARALWLQARTQETCFALLQLTAELDALTAGLFHDAAVREESACAGGHGR
jgi:hypothetical protein